MSIFVKKNWSNDPRVSCYTTNLVELIEADAELKEELKKFEGCFDRNETQDM
jgi:hypothetical protein